jgi:hypothetical protein
MTLLLARIEQPEAAKVLLELDEQAGLKGDFVRRLDDAMDTIRHCLSRRQTNALGGTLTDNDTASLQKINDLILRRKDNLRSPGIRR